MKNRSHMLPQRCRSAETGLSRNQVDAEIRLLKQLPRPFDTLTDKPLRRGYACFFRNRRVKLRTLSDS